MLNAIRFVRGAVAKKDYVAELTHFLIQDGRITGYNGIIGLSAPIDLDIEARPKAVTFANALNKCEGQVTMHMTKAGRLSVRSGRFRALIDCLPDDHSIIPTVPIGHEIDVGPNFMEAIRRTEKYQGIDASRPWSMGLLFTGQSVMATNNVIFVEYWHGHQMPFDILLPTVAVKELLRINKDPIRVTAAEGQIVFHFEDDRWLRSAVLATPWPDKAKGLLDREFNYKPVPDGLFEGLETIKPFLDKDERVYTREGIIGTSPNEELGAHFDVEGIPSGQCYTHRVLSLLSDATKIDFDPFPAPCGFLAPGLRGMFLGMKI